ncbi:MAG: LPS export ABC transporter periplasmic protein LptC [Thiobacillus sp.]|nr:LPS export ABC transporter periplasmic protein LptC [Thiobacillus sp.]
MSGAGMQQSGSFWLPLVIAGGLVILTTWLGQLAERPKANGDGTIRHDPDYFVEDFNATAFDAAGKPRYRLAAVRMTHYMDDDSAELIAPRFVREGTGVARVVVRSLRGLVSSEGENVYFLGDVRMMSERAGNGSPIELTSEYLRVIPDSDLIRTDKPVLIKDGRAELRGGAMQADGKKNTLELTGRVKGIYENRH